MSNATSQTCSSCGARLPESAQMCDLCGRPVDPDDTDPDTPPNTPTDTPASARTGAASRSEEETPAVEGPRASSNGSNGAQTSASARESDGPYCHACGWQNPVDARFCTQCGTKLQAKQPTPAAAPAAVPVDANLPRGSADEAAPPEDPEEVPATADESEDESGVGQHLTLVFGGVFVLVIGLFLISTWSQQRQSGGSAETSASSSQPALQSSPQAAPATGGPGVAAPPLEELVAQVSSEAALPAQMANRVDSLQAALADQPGAQVQSTRQQLINTYIGAGRLGAAALAQKQTAEASDAPDAWRRTGDLLYSWMETLEGQPAAVQVAEHVVEAYQRVLDQQPGNLDVRTDMATAYLQTNNPMRGVEEINRVLDEDPDHFQARFNKGIMLVMIGRIDPAIEQFEQVKGIVGEESPYYQQADQAIQTIREREAAAAESTDTP